MIASSEYHVHRQQRQQQHHHQQQQQLQTGEQH